MVCDGSDPDLGSAAGVGSQDWDTLRIYQTNITLTCPFGQAFDTNYTVELVNTCDYQSDDATQVDWTYNANNALPSCIRKCYHLLYKTQWYNHPPFIPSSLTTETWSLQSLLCSID